MLFYIAAISSSLFRVASYIFLRVVSPFLIPFMSVVLTSMQIPTRAGPIALPVLYLLSLTSLLLSPQHQDVEVKPIKEERLLQENGSVKKETPVELKPERSSSVR